MSTTDFPDKWQTLAADLFAHHEVVLDRLARVHPGVDGADLHDSFVNAILDIAATPSKFDSSRGTRIEDFLFGAAERTLTQILRGHLRRKNREEKKAAAVGNDPSAARLPLEALADAETARNARAVAESNEERKVLELWELGHADAEIAALAAMDVTMVRRIRDRVTQRLRRLKDRLEDDIN